MAMDVGSSGIPLEHQKFDEAHDLSESDELESSIETNPSPVKRQSKQDARGDSPPHFDFNDSPPRQDGMDDSDSTDSDRRATDSGSRGARCLGGTSSSLCDGGGFGKQLLTLGLGACFHSSHESLLAGHCCVRAIQLFPFIYDEGLNFTFGSEL